MSVSATNHSETLLTVVVNTSTGGTGGWFGLCSSVSDDPTKFATTGLFNSLKWEGSVQLPYVLDELMVRSLKILSYMLHLIIGFCSVDACVKRPFLAKSCF